MVKRVDVNIVILNNTFPLRVNLPSAKYIRFFILEMELLL